MKHEKDEKIIKSNEQNLFCRFKNEKIKNYMYIIFL